MPKTLASRIKLEGENELRAALKNLKASYRELESELKAITSSTKDQANKLDTLRQKNEALTDMVEKQKEALKLLEKGRKDAFLDVVFQVDCKCFHRFFFLFA